VVTERHANDREGAKSIGRAGHRRWKCRGSENYARVVKTENKGKELMKNAQVNGMERCGCGRGQNRFQIWGQVGYR